MNEAKTGLYTATGTYTIDAYPGGAISTRTSPLINGGTGVTTSGNSTINYSNNSGLSTAVTLNSINMAPRQVQVAVFTITRDKKTNEINSTKFVKQLWIEQKNGISIDLLVAKQLGNDFDPETTVIREIVSFSF